MQNCKYILLSIILILPLLLKGQEPGRFDMPQGGSEMARPHSSEKKVVSKVQAWQLRQNGALTDSVTIDTLYKFYHNYNPIYQESISNTTTGNYAGSYESNDFSKRKFGTGFYFANTHDIFFLTPERINFYNTRTPYTLLDYSQSENKSRKDETRLNVLHSQNVNKNLNFTFRYDQAKSSGQYNYQETSNHFITLYGSYTSEKLNVYAGYINARVRYWDNGGLTDDKHAEEVDKTENMPVNLTDARTELKNSQIFATGEYILGKTIENDSISEFRPFVSAIYDFNFSNFRRVFIEGDKLDNSEFFNSVAYVNEAFSQDSLRFMKISNVFQLKSHESAQKKFSFGQRVYIGIDIVQRVYAAPGFQNPVFPFHEGVYIDNVYLGPKSRTDNETYTNVYLGGGIFRQLGNFWTWDFEGRQYISGYMAGQTEINGVISKPINFWKDSLACFQIKGDLYNRRPDYFQQKFFSNRIQWTNDLSNEQTMNASFDFFSPKRKLSAGFRYSLINNFIYHNESGIPAQANSQQLVLSAYLNKDFDFKHFGLKFESLWQNVSAQQYLSLPDFTVRIAPYVQAVLAKVLYLQLGVDARYNTKYYADAYNPATGFFHLQREKKIGGYPQMDAFANLKLKRTRVFFYLMNFGATFIKEPYFTALHHPMNQMTFRLGVAWSFYN